MAAPVSHLGSKQGDGEERFRQFLRQSPRAFWSAMLPSPCRERLLRLRLGHRFVGAAFEKLAEERQTQVFYTTTPKVDTLFSRLGCRAFAAIAQNAPWSMTGAFPIDSYLLLEAASEAPEVAAYM